MNTFSQIPIRRKDREISREDTERILREAEYGTLAMCDDGEPYAVPVSFVFWQNAVWIHSAQAGRKIRILEKSPRVHFSVAQNVQAVFTKHFTSFYESAMISGKAVFVTDENEKRAALRELCRKYLPERMDVAGEHISRSLAATAILKIPAETLAGKAQRP